MTRDEPKTYVFHADSDDGFTGAWAIWRNLGQSAVYRVHAPLPAEMKRITPGSTIYTVDVAVSDAPEGVRVIAFRTTEGSSAARLAWEAFHRTGPSDFLCYIETARLGREDHLPDAAAILTWIDSWERDFVKWTELATALAQDRAGVVREGEAILRAARKKA